MLNVIILTLEFSIAGKCFFLESFIWRFSCDFLTVFLGGEVNWRGGTHRPAFRSGLRGSESWSVLCTGGSAGAALCVEDMTVLRDEKGISSAA